MTTGENFVLFQSYLADVTLLGLARLVQHSPAPQPPAESPHLHFEAIRPVAFL